MSSGSQATGRAAEEALCASDPDLAALIARAPRKPPMPEAQREPYEALVRAIAHQQVHGRAAEAILGRMLALFPSVPFPHAGELLALPEEQLRTCGFSGAKVAAIRDICVRTLDGTVPSLAAAADLDDEALIARLTTLRGVGRWTVEMLLIFCLDRPDVLPVDDFGVREGWRLIKRLPAQPRPRELARIGEAWSPYRSTAAWYLWRASDEGKRFKPVTEPAPRP